MRTHISRSSKRGVALVEASLCITLLVIVFIGIVNVGRIFTTQVAMTNAAREGARWAAGHSTDYTGIANSVLNELKSSRLVPQNSTVGTASTVSGVTTVPITATVSSGSTFISSASGKAIYGSTTPFNIADVTVSQVADGISTNGQKMKVSVTYGFRAYMGSWVGMNSKNLLAEAEMIKTS